MANEQAQRLLQQGIAAVRAGQKEMARQLLQDAIRLDPSNENAWLWLTSVANNDMERIYSLTKVLEINPQNQAALKGLQKLGVQPPNTAQRRQITQQPPPNLDVPGAPPPPSQPPPQPPTGTLRRLGTSGLPKEQADPRRATGSMPRPGTGGLRRPGTGGLPKISGLPQIDTGDLRGKPRTGGLGTPPPSTPPMSSPTVSEDAYDFSMLGAAEGSFGPTGMSSVPMPNPNRLDALNEVLDTFLIGYQEVPEVTLPYTWTRKTRNRIGEMSEQGRRVRIFAGLATALIAVGGGALLLISAIVSGGNPIAFAATWTPAPTETPLPTATSGLTATPSRTPAVLPSPTEAPNFPRGSIYNPTATPPYPIPQSRGIQNAIREISAGRYAEAITLLENELRASELAKNRDYYTALYYITLAYVEQNRASEALRLIQTHQNIPTDSEAIFNTALAVAAYGQGDYDTALAQANIALREDRQMVQAAIIAARVHTLRRDFAAARTALSNALTVNERDVNLLIELARVQLVEGRLNDALKDAELALYIDPLNRDAYVIRNQVLLARAATEVDRTAREEAYGLAVIGAQGYLLYYPGDVEAWLQLGLAREGEGNFSAALDAYNQALVDDPSSETARDALIARGRLRLQLRQFSGAVEDLGRAIAIRPDEQAHRFRLEAARAAGDYAAALDDADALLRLNPNDPNLISLQLEALVGAYVRKAIGQTRMEQDKARITDEVIASLPPNGREAGYLYRGIVRYLEQDYGGAETDFILALNIRLSGIGHYYRALVYEAQGKIAEAVRDLQWIAFWEQVASFPLAQEVSSKLAALATLLPTETATPTPTPTLSPTATSTPSYTPTRTNTPTPSRTAIPTRTLRPSRTPIPTRTPLPTRTPRVSATPTPVDAD